MLSRFFRQPEPGSTVNPPLKAIQSARQWQRRLRWLAWLLPVLISLGAYGAVWFWFLRPGESMAELRQASNIIFFAALGALLLGLFIYQIQLVLSQQVATSAELERKVDERTRHITEVMTQLDEQNRALRVLDHQKTEFVTLISHELRAPLTNINGGLELLLSRDNNLSESSRDTLTLVTAEAARLTRFVETILNVSAIESGQLPTVIGPVSVASAVRHVVGQFPNLPENRIVIAVSNDLPPAMADEHYVQSVIYHLVDNAIKYAPEGSVWITALTRDGRVETRVTDSGPGVSPENAARLFTMFERLDARDSQFVYGYGLGLYMCKRLMRSMNGDIWLDSEVKPGATFVVSFPIWQETLLPAENLPV